MEFFRLDSVQVWEAISLAVEEVDPRGLTIAKCEHDRSARPCPESGLRQRRQRTCRNGPRRIPTPTANPPEPTGPTKAFRRIYCYAYSESRTPRQSHARPSGLRLIAEHHERSTGAHQQSSRREAHQRRRHRTIVGPRRAPDRQPQRQAPDIYGLPPFRDTRPAAGRRRTGRATVCDPQWRRVASARSAPLMPWSTSVDSVSARTTTALFDTRSLCRPQTPSWAAAQLHELRSSVTARSQVSTSVGGHPLGVLRTPQRTKMRAILT